MFTDIHKFVRLLQLWPKIMILMAFHNVGQNSFHISYISMNLDSLLFLSQFRQSSKITGESKFRDMWRVLGLSCDGRGPAVLAQTIGRHHPFVKKSPSGEASQIYNGLQGEIIIYIMYIIYIFCVLLYETDFALERMTEDGKQRDKTVGF